MDEVAGRRAQGPRAQKSRQEASMSPTVRAPCAIAADQCAGAELWHLTGPRPRTINAEENDHFGIGDRQFTARGTDS
ncbi:hypothetical protein [Actinosynnema sp. NPDC023587]|uniref:hypothetical protein n=1 Tax=Actinosynnema sp. NPDC023587 TaxID=3154695 RepID=UPI0033EE20C7